MKERWKPENGERYFCVDFGYFGIVSDHCWGILPICDSKFYEVGNVFKTKAEAQAAAEKVKALMLGLHGEQTVTDCNQLPKLTVEVFDRPDCPKWAMYAAVTPHGSLLFFAEKPIIVKNENNFEKWNTDKNWYYGGMGYFDTSDWQNSLIERPIKETKLPDWCKVGEWVYDKAINRYSQVAAEDITEGFQEVCKYISKGEIVPARLRPYNADEMLELVGKVICGNDTDFRAMIVYADGGTNRVETIHYDYDAEELARCYNIDGKPCGVLEHLKNGEWVK
jgi:hypothetical protein